MQYEKPGIVDTKKTGKAPTASFSPPQKQTIKTVGSKPDPCKAGKSKKKPVEPEQIRQGF